MKRLVWLLVICFVAPLSAQAQNPGRRLIRCLPNSGGCWTLMRRIWSRCPRIPGGEVHLPSNAGRNDGRNAMAHIAQVNNSVRASVGAHRPGAGKKR